MSHVQGISEFVNPTKIERYVSPLQTITVSTILTLAHGLSKEPDIVQLYLVCTTDNLGYVVGDVVQMGLTNFSAASGGEDYGAMILKDDTNVDLLYADGSGGRVFIGYRKDTQDAAGMVNTNWKAFVVALSFTIGDVPDIVTVGLVPLEKKVIAAGSADIEFQLAQYFNQYEDFEIDIKGFQTTTNDQDLAWQSAPDGTTYDQTANDYVRQQDWGTNTSSASASDTTAVHAIVTTFSTGTVNEREHHTHHLKLYSFADPNEHSRIYSVSFGASASPNPFVARCFMTNTNLQQDQSIRFISTSGNLEQGTFILYGKRKVA